MSATTITVKEIAKKLMDLAYDADNGFERWSDYGKWHRKNDQVAYYKYKSSDGTILLEQLFYVPKVKEKSYKRNYYKIDGASVEYNVSIDGENSTLILSNQWGRDRGNVSLRDLIMLVNDVYQDLYKIDFSFGESETDFVKINDIKNNTTNEFILPPPRKGGKNISSMADKAKSDGITEYYPHNIIYYGVPGSGKSYSIDNTIRDLLSKSDSEFDKLEERKQKELINQHQIRTVFHPDYTYADFVGQIIPTLVSTDDEQKRQLSYEFKPGPFTEAIKRAIELKESKKPFFLIIEEINRGNAPAIFGDIFQLLDRANTGESEYKIDNEEIGRYANDLDSEEELFEEQRKVQIPGNLYIIGTMNTSDQNVFTLDTAFKRRWSMRHIKNDFNEGDTFWKNTLFGTDVKWKDFWKAINDRIVKENKTSMGNADSRLGVHFVNGYELETKKLFGEKVLMYLWEDAFKYADKSSIFNNLEGKGYDSLDSLLNDFEDIGLSVFDSSFKFVKTESNAGVSQDAT